MNEGALIGFGGFLVADVRGRRVGRVVSPMYGRSAEEPDALAVGAGLLGRRRYLVPAAAIKAIDGRSRIIGLRLSRNDLLRFL
jgi:hypothetical protein